MRIIFAGTPEFAVSPLKALLESQHEIIGVYTQPDRPSGRGRTLHKSPVKQLAEQHKLPIFQPESLKDIQAQTLFRELHADLMIVVAYGLILPPAILSMPQYGCINIHASLLPRWRGAAPIQHAILSGDNMTGISIMQMDAGLDTGDVLFTQSCSIEAEETSQTLHDKLAILGSKTLIHVLEKFVEGTIVAIPQPSAGVTYAHKILKEHAKMDWQASAIDLERKIRAFNPWPIAFTHFQNDKSDQKDQNEAFRIWAAKIVRTNENALQKGENEKSPGTLLQATEQGIDVATGDGILRILEMQLPGGKRLPIREILHSKAEIFQVGKVFC